MASGQQIHLAYDTHEPVQGADEEVPIIYLHGATVSKENWGDIPQVVANATGRKSFSLDARNHGDSNWSDVFDFQINVDDLLLFMDKMNISKAILVGHSMGGITAIKTALRQPDKVEKLIVEDMSPRYCSQKLVDQTVIFLKLAKKAIQNVPSGLRIDEAKEFITDFANGKLNENMKKFQPNDPRLILKENPDGSYAFKCNVDVLIEVLSDANSVLTKFEGLYKGPSCFIYGNKSPFLIGHDIHKLKQFFPDLTMVGIENADHEVHAKYPLPFTEALLQFLQGGWNKKIKT